MADKSLIEWTDATWQVVTGCSIESPGCKNCYAMKLAGGRLQHHPSRAGLTQPSAAGPVWTGEVRFNMQWLNQPLQWKRPRMIFVAAHGDLFHPAVPDAWIDKVFAVMALAPHHTYQVLTKRTERMRQYLCDPGRKVAIQNVIDDMETWDGGFIPRVVHAPLIKQWPLRNVLIGTSVENQAYADVRREPLRQIATAGWTTWVSYEPAIGRVNWEGWEFMRWMVAGGESGTNARPASPSWFHDARDYCLSHGIAFNFKQHGAWAPGNGGPGGDLFERDRTKIKSGFWTYNDEWVDAGPNPFRQTMDLIGKEAAGRLLDGVLHNEFPRL